MPEFFPLQLLLATFAGWVNREQAQIVAYLAEENQLLREQLGDRRPRLTDDQRRRLAAKGKVLGWRLLHRVATIVTPDTIIRWQRRLIAAKWTHPTKRVDGFLRGMRFLIIDRDGKFPAVLPDPRGRRRLRRPHRVPGAEHERHRGAVGVVR